MKNQKGNACAVIAVLGLILVAGLAVILIVFSMPKFGTIPNLLPENTALYATVNLKQTLSVYNRGINLAGKENYTKYMDQLLKFLGDMGKIDAKQLTDKVIGNLKSWIGPEAAFASSVDGIRGKSQEFALIATVRNPKTAGEKFKELVDEIAKIEDKNRKIEWKTETYKKIEINCFKEVCFCVMKKALFITPPDYIKKLVDFNTGPRGKTLAATDFFKRVKKSMGKNVLSYVAFNIEAFHSDIKKLIDDEAGKEAPKDLLDEYEPLQGAVAFVTVDQNLTISYKIAILLNPNKMKNSDILGGIEADGKIKIKGALMGKLNEWITKLYMGLRTSPAAGEKTDEEKMMDDLMEYNKAFYGAIESYAVSGRINREEASMTIEIDLIESKLRDLPWEKASGVFKILRKGIEKSEKQSGISRCQTALEIIRDAENNYFFQNDNQFADLDALYQGNLVSPEIVTRYCGKVDLELGSASDTVSITAQASGVTPEECTLSLYIDQYERGNIQRRGTICGNAPGGIEPYSYIEFRGLADICDAAKETVNAFAAASPQMLQAIKDNYKDQLDALENKQTLTEEDIRNMGEIRKWMWKDILDEAGVDLRCADYYVENSWEPNPGEVQPPAGENDSIPVNFMWVEDEKGHRTYSVGWNAPPDLSPGAYSLTIVEKGKSPEDPNAIRWQVLDIPAEVTSVDYGVVTQGARAGIVDPARELTPGEYDILIKAYSEPKPDYSRPESVIAAGSSWMTVE